MLILENKNPPMRKLTQPWKLCRSFGSQPVGNVAGPRWPKAGIAAQVIPPLPSRRTFRKGQSPTGDLPTCVLDSSCSSEVPTIFNSKVRKFAASFSCRPRLPFKAQQYYPNVIFGISRAAQSSSILLFPMETVRNPRPKPCLWNTPSLPEPRQLSKRLLRCHGESSANSCQDVYFRMKTARNIILCEFH